MSTDGSDQADKDPNPMPPINQGKPPDHTSDPTSEEARAYAKALFTNVLGWNWAVFFSGVVAVFTIVTAQATCNQAKLTREAIDNAKASSDEDSNKIAAMLEAMRESNGITREALGLNRTTLERQYRARVAMGIITLEDPEMAAGKDIEVVISFVNAGGSAAELRYWAMIEIADKRKRFDDASGKDISTNRDSRSVWLEANALLVKESRVQIPAFNAAQVAAIENAEAFFYVRGIARYGDDFCAERELRFCNVWNPKGKRFTICDGWNSELPCQHPR